jgi:hypothetical protein
MYRPKPSRPCDMPVPGMPLKALVLNASLKHEPAVSNSGELADLVVEAAPAGSRGVAAFP